MMKRLGTKHPQYETEMLQKIPAPDLHGFVHSSDSIIGSLSNFYTTERLNMFLDRQQTSTFYKGYSGCSGTVEPAIK